MSCNQWKNQGDLLILLTKKVSYFQVVILILNFELNIRQKKVKTQSVLKTVTFQLNYKHKEAQSILLLNFQGLRAGV